MIANYLTEKRAAQFEAAKALLNQEVIYNVDFTEAKFYLGRIFDEAKEKMVNAPFFWAGKFESVPEEINELHWLSWSAHLAPSLLKKVTKVNVDHPARDAMLELLNEFAPVMVALKDAKGRVVKGRKPSDNPSSKPARTIENTGTCGCCGKNVKMDSAGFLVAHGYTIKYGFQSGNCFGVGFKPFEESNESVAYYLSALRDHLEVLEDTQVPEDRNAAYALERDIRHIGMDIEYFTKRLNAWEAKPLPGTK